MLIKENQNSKSTSCKNIVNNSINNKINMIKLAEQAQCANIRLAVRTIEKRLVPVVLTIALSFSTTACQSVQNYKEVNNPVQKVLEFDKNNKNTSLNLIEKRTLKSGMKGQDVSILQLKLMYLGLNIGDTDGIFGNDTKNAVLSIQEFCEVTKDGIVGEQTRSKIDSLFNRMKDEFSEKESEVIKNKLCSIQNKIIKQEEEKKQEIERKRLITQKETDLKNSLKLNSEGEDVKKLQTALSATGYYKGTVTGKYDKATEEAVKKLQQEFSIRQSGIFGKDTSNMLKQLIQKPSEVVNEVKVDYSQYERIVNKNSMLKNQIEKIKPTILEKLNLSEGELTKDDMTMICYGILLGIDDNVCFGAVQWMSELEPANHNYFFVRSKAFTDAAFVAYFLKTTAVTGAAALKNLADAGAAGAFALATCETGFGAVGGGIVLTKECIEAIASGAAAAGSGYMYSRSVDNLKASAEKIKSVQKPDRLKYEDITDDILDYSEKNAGHSLQKHVSKSEQELIERAFKEDVDATSFENKAAAIKAVKENLKNNIKKINEYLASTETKPGVFEWQHSYTIGKGAYENSKSVIKDINKSRIIIVKDSTSKMGFFIKTSFPVFKFITK